jgi:hypothetical protein
VGRAALDEEAIRLLEEYNPDVEFDWTRILKGQGAETHPAPRTDRDYRAERIERRRQERAQRIESFESDSAESAETTGLAERTEMAATGVAELVAPMPFAIEAIEEPLPVAEPPADAQPPRPSHARLGSEGLARLRARHAEVLARVSERVQDPARQEELKAQAERLNPDSWVTEAEVTAGLEAYESVFEALRSAVGGPSRRRRRRRRGGGQQSGAPRNGSDQAADGEPEGDRPTDEDPNEDL